MAIFGEWGVTGSRNKPKAKEREVNTSQHNNDQSHNFTELQLEEIKGAGLGHRIAWQLLTFAIWTRWGKQWIGLNGMGSRASKIGSKVLKELKQQMQTSKSCLGEKKKNLSNVS